MYILGMDTSNYTTSVCALEVDSGCRAAEARKVLPVPLGKKGLRQSEALFLHLQQIPEVFSQLMSQLRKESSETIHWAALAVSVRPRPFSSSYMPVFTAGQSWMTTLGLTLGVPVIRTSHQEGHIAAAEHFLSPPRDPAAHFAVHISGGTSDVLLAQPTRFGYRITTLGEGLDLHAGQFIDRVGVRMGFAFPTGPALEQLAAQCSFTGFRLPSRVVGAQMSFSGPCAAALRALEERVNPSEVAFAVEQCVANSVVKALCHAHESFPQITQAIVAGGVAANQHIRKRIQSRLRISCPKLQVFYAPVQYSSDNALGVAAIGRRYLLTP